MILDSVKNTVPFARSPSLLAIFVVFMSTALAASTLGNYAPHEEAYLSFCQGFGVPAPFPLSCGVLCGFLCHYFQQQKPFSAIKTALAAIRNLAIILGHDISALASERLALAKRAYKRHARKHSPRPPRVPITVWVLHALAKLLGKDDDAPFALACAGVFGLFRGGELAYKGPKQGVLKRRDATWLDDVVIVHLEASKSDIERKGADVRLYKNSSLVCPYTRMRTAFDRAPIKGLDDPLFQLPSGLPISYSFMLGWIKAMMVLLGVPADRVGLHSLRIGGATSLAMLGVPAHIIKIFGRWESLAYQLYIQTPDSKLRAYMDLLADASAKSSCLFGGLDLDSACAITDDSLDSLPRFVTVSAPAKAQGGRRR